LTLTNYASGVISGDAGGVSGNQTPTLNVTNFGTITGGAQSAGTGAIGGNTVNVTNFGTLTTWRAAAQPRSTRTAAPSSTMPAA
jgi:hypothetical protein